MAVKIGKSPISNSHQGLRFKITPRDIENGQPNDPCACAAARALKREFNAKEVFVFRDVTYVVQRGGTALRFNTSPALRLETIVFDREGNFYPGEYDLYPARETTKKSKRQNAGVSPKRRNVLHVRHVIPNVRPTASQRLARVD